MRQQKEGGFLVDKIHHLARRTFAAKLKEYGIENLNAAQGRIMFVLWRNNNIPIQQLAKETGLGKSTLTSMLDRLEKSGHIVRTPSAADRRETVISAGRTAKTDMDRYLLVSQEMTELFYHGFTSTEIGGFESYLRRILTNLSDHA